MKRARIKFHHERMLIHGAACPQSSGAFIYRQLLDVHTQAWDGARAMYPHSHLTLQYWMDGSLGDGSACGLCMHSCQRVFKLQ